MAIPVAPIGRIIKDAGAERVSEEAKKELNAYVEAQAAKVAKKAIKFAELAKRKTVKAEDIELNLDQNSYHYVLVISLLFFYCFFIFFYIFF